MQNGGILITIKKINQNKIMNFIFDERRYGWLVDKHYDSINMLMKMQLMNPRRFNEFQYTNSTIYDYIDRVQNQQNTYD